jgi:hypothetical protein
MKKAKKFVPLKVDGFDSAIIGTDVSSGRIIYDEEKMIHHLMKRDKINYTDSLEYLEFNVFTAYMGETQPIYMRKKKVKPMNKMTKEDWEEFFVEAIQEDDLYEIKKSVDNGVILDEDFVRDAIQYLSKETADYLRNELRKQKLNRLL